jgi:hypothetical protein
VKKLYSASEIAAMNLPGLPKSKPALLARAEKEEWFYETKLGLGGVRKMFSIPAAYLPGYQPLPPEKPTKDPKTKATEVAERIAAKATDSDGDKIDPERLAYAISFLEEYLTERNIQIAPDRKSKVVISLYNLMKTNENAEDIRNLLKLVA